MASSIVTSAAQQLGTLLVEEAKYLYAVSDKIKNLQSELEWMQCFLEDADNRQHQEKMVRKWVAEIRDFAYEAEDLIERYVDEVSHPQQSSGIWNTIKWFSCVCGDVVVLHDIGSSMDDLSSKISKLISRLQMYGIQIIKQTEGSTYDFARREQRRTYSHIEEKTFGLGNHMKEIVDKLTNEDEVKVVGISGLGGLGKTTLARKVYLDKRVKEHFKNCVWVYISKQFERRNVLEEIYTGLSLSRKDNDGRKVKHLTNEELPRKICKLLEEDECLVLLDDIWTNDAWDNLKPAFESMKISGSKILITTRNIELVRHVDPAGYTHPLGILSEENGWKLLQQTAFVEETNTAAEVKAKMEELGKAMLKHCKGLPLAIVALGGILATKRTIHEWKTVSKNIRSYLSDMVREGRGDRVLSVLELSYDDLPFYLKPCFMYLGCFPEDYEIPADRLYHLWEAEGLVTMPSDDKAENHGVRLDDIAESYLNQLVNRSMVQVEKRWPNRSIMSCRLHDVMRDMCLKKCKEVNFIKIAEGGNSEELSDCNTVGTSPMNRKLRRCVISSKDKHFGDDSFFDAVDLNEAPYLRSLLVFTYHEGYLQSDKLLSLNSRQYFSLLRVLDLEGLEMGYDVPVIKHCIHLRYLSLRGVWARRVLDFIWDCKYLETLDLRINKYTERLELRNELWKLERLRHLYLPSWFVVVGFDKLRLTLNQLRQMETFVNFDKKWCQMEDLEKMINLRTFSFISSNKRIDNRDDLRHLIKSPAIRNGRLKGPLNLCIHAKTIEGDPTIWSSLKSICINELTICGRTEAVAFDELGEDANNDIQIFPRSLTRFRSDGYEIGEQGIKELEKLPHLEELELYGRAAIRGSKMSFSEGGFKKLLKLSLSFITGLEEWEVGEGALPSLLYLEIFGCEKLERIPEGLPSSMKISCYPSIDGSDKYKEIEVFEPVFRPLFGL